MSQKLAIDGGAPVRRAPFPAWPVFDEREEEALIEVVRAKGAKSEFDYIRRFNAHPRLARALLGQIV